MTSSQSVLPRTIFFQRTPCANCYVAWVIVIVSYCKIRPMSRKTRGNSQNLSNYSSWIRWNTSQNNWIFCDHYLKNVLLRYLFACLGVSELSLSNEDANGVSASVLFKYMKYKTFIFSCLIWPYPLPKVAICCCTKVTNLNVTLFQGSLISILE